MKRYDTILAPDWMQSKFEKTPEGYLKGRAVICSTGIYEYRKEDGSIVKELRLPEDVFASTFLESLKLLPVTNDHPTEMVTTDNIKKYQVGNLGTNPSAPSSQAGDISEAGEPTGYQFYNTDMYHVAIDMVIQDKDTIEDVLSGKRELSVGYTCELEAATPGARYLGQTYDFIQRNLIANHLAIVEKGRCGDAARIRLDSADAIMVSDAVPRTAEKDTCGGTPMADLKKVKLDGGVMEYEADEKVIIALDTAVKKADSIQVSLDTMTQEKSKVEAERDTLKDRADSLEKELASLKAEKLDSKKIDEAVAKKVALLGVAKEAGIEIKTDMSDLDIQKAIVLSQFPDAKLDGKDAVYIDARYDGAVEFMAKKGDAETRKAGADQTEQKSDGIPIVDSRKAREAMLARLEKKGE